MTTCLCTLILQLFASNGRNLYTSTMRQIWMTDNKKRGNLHLQEAAEPVPHNGEVRIRVEAIGVNYADILHGIRIDTPDKPYVPGFEVSGVVDLVSQGVGDLKEGDAVFAFTNYGGYSDVICVPHKQVFRRFNWMSAEDAVTLPMNYLGAYVMLVVMGSLKADEKVFIHTAASGLGIAALDICSIIGAETFGTAVTDAHDFLYKRGLDHPIDHRHIDYEREVKAQTQDTGVQIVLDTFGGIHWPKNYRLLAPSGRLIHGGMQDLAIQTRRDWLAALRNLVMLPFYTPLKLMHDNKGVIGVDLIRLWEHPELTRTWMAQLTAWYDEALFRPQIDKVFKLEEVAAAHQYLQKRHNLGKVVLKP